MSGSQKTTQTQSQNSQTSPWGPQADALTQGFSDAQTALGKASTATAPTDFTAQFTPDQLNTFRSMLGFGNGSTVSADNAASGNTLANAGVSGATGALSSLLGFTPQNATASNIADATQYANNPAISGMVDAAMRDANQEATDVTLPGIDRAAALTGNTNSSRTGIADGLVQRGLAQQAGDISSQLRGQAYDNGLNLASNNNQFNINSMLSALTGAGSLGGSLAGLGIGARSGSLNDAGTAYGIANTGGAGVQAADQANLTNQQQQYQSQTTSPFDALQQYMQIVGGNNWGSTSSGTSTGTTTSTPSAWQVIGGLMGAGGSLMKGAGSMGLSFA